MRNTLLLFALLLIAAACQSKQDGEQKADKTIILHEDSIRGLALPFERTDMSERIQKAFEHYTLDMEKRKINGPEFPLYVFKEGQTELGYITMDWQDSLKLYDIRLTDSSAKDQYGLKVGDGFETIQEKRKGEVKTMTDFLRNTYAFVPGSHIIYKLAETELPSDATAETKQAAIQNPYQNWKIEQVIWLRYPAQNGN